jgi:hypothetical protein
MRKAAGAGGAGADAGGLDAGGGGAGTLTGGAEAAPHAISNSPRLGSDDGRMRLSLHLLGWRRTRKLVSAWACSSLWLRGSGLGAEAAPAPLAPETGSASAQSPIPVVLFIKRQHT